MNFKSEFPKQGVFASIAFETKTYDTYFRKEKF